MLYELENGKHIVRLAVYADNVSMPVLRYVEVFWNGKTPKDVDLAHFNVCLHTEKEFKSITGGAV